MNAAQQGYTTTGTQVQHDVQHALPLTGFDVAPAALAGFLLVLVGAAI